MSQTTVSPTTNHSGASYVIKLDGASDADGVVAFGVGSNVITVEVTAQDGPGDPELHGHGNPRRRTFLGRPHSATSR